MDIIIEGSDYFIIIAVVVAVVINIIIVIIIGQLKQNHCK